MTFLEAKAELKELAKGKHHYVEYGLTEYQSGRLEAKCWLYVDPHISSLGDTWEEAINKMKVKLGLIEKKVDLSEIPREEIKKEE